MYATAISLTGFRIRDGVRRISSYVKSPYIIYAILHALYYCREKTTSNLSVQTGSHCILELGLREQDWCINTLLGLVEPEDSSLGSFA